MAIFQWWSSLDLAAQIFYCIAIPATLVLIIQTVLMLFGLEDSAEGDLDADLADIDTDDGVFDDSMAEDLSDAAGLDSLHIFTVRGIVAFLVIFGWVGAIMQSSGSPLYLTLPIAFVCGIAMMFAIAYLFKAVMKLRNNGNADNRNAVGVAGRVYLTIPPSRSGEGKVNVLLQGAYVERNAVTDETEAIPTGSEIIVTGTSGQTDLVVKRK